MEFLELQDLNHWQLWTPLIGGLIFYIGLRIRVLRDEEEK